MSITRTFTVTSLDKVSMECVTAPLDAGEVREQGLRESRESFVFSGGSWVRGGLEAMLPPFRIEDVWEISQEPIIAAFQ